MPDTLRAAGLAKRGGARRDRTADLVIANDALSQLSYGPFRGRLQHVGDGQQSAPFTVRAKAKSRTAKSLIFGLFVPELPLFGRGGTDI
jgi:hypothetical protein